MQVVVYITNCLKFSKKLTDLLGIMIVILQKVIQILHM